MPKKNKHDDNDAPWLLPPAQMLLASGAGTALAMGGQWAARWAYARWFRSDSPRGVDADVVFRNQDYLAVLGTINKQNTIAVERLNDISKKAMELDKQNVVFQTNLAQTLRALNDIKTKNTQLDQKLDTLLTHPTATASGAAAESEALQARIRGLQTDLIAAQDNIHNLEQQQRQQEQEAPGSTPPPPPPPPPNALLSSDGQGGFSAIGDGGAPPADIPSMGGGRAASTLFGTRRKFVPRGSGDSRRNTVESEIGPG